MNAFNLHLIASYWKTLTKIISFPKLFYLFHFPTSSFVIQTLDDKKLQNRKFIFMEYVIILKQNTWGTKKENSSIYELRIMGELVINFSLCYFGKE